MIASTSTPPSVRVLIVDDLPAIHDDYRKILAPAKSSALDVEAAMLFGQPAAPQLSLPFTLDSAFQGEDAASLVKNAVDTQQPYAIAFVDMRMPPGWNGVETVRHLWALDPRLQVVICTAYSDYSWSDTVKILGQSDNLIILKKPFDHIEVQQLAHALARKWQLAREAEHRISDLDTAVRERTTELRHAEEGFTQVFDASPLAQAIIALDTGEILAVNGAFEKTIGLTQSRVAGQTPETFGYGVDPVRWRELLAKVSAGEPVDDYPFTYTPTLHVRRAMRGSARYLSIRSRPCSVWVVRDVTDQLRLEEQARQSQKMDAVGQLAAGVAHDFNNLLTAIHGFTEQALLETQEPATRTLLQPVLAAALRAAALTRQLLVFSRKQATEPTLLDIADVLRGVQPMLRRLLGEHIDLQWEIPTHLPCVFADIANLEQVVVNLALNARDALPLTGGTLRIAAGTREFATDGDAAKFDGRAGRFVTIEVQDNGSGVSAEVLPHIFEPFFTTKEVGKGTGLGLSTVYSIVRQHDGWINVQTSVGRGTTFTVFQPIAESPEAPATVTPATRRGGISPAQLTAHRVLAVEDDPAVQSILAMLFKRHGIDAVIASDGTSALRLWEENGGKFGLLITDVVMPNGCTGIQLARTLRERNADLKVVIMTGYSADLLDPAQLGIPGAPPRLLFKPFDLNDVLTAIAQT
jgi:PAS domain S-box-containing protein